MFTRRRRRTVGRMLIRIWRDDTPALSGRVALDGGEPERFEGWLQLLRILTELLGPAGRSGPAARGGGGELDP
jgi:hypothetical protein